jgi:hypothetical protein
LVVPKAQLTDSDAAQASLVEATSHCWERVYEAGGEVNEKSTDSSKGPASEAAGRTQASFFVGMHDLK